jgi:hypothetical protein
MLLSIRYILIAGFAVFPLSHQIRRFGGKKMSATFVHPAAAEMIHQAEVLRFAAPTTPRAQSRHKQRSPRQTATTSGGGTPVVRALFENRHIGLILVGLIFIIHGIGLLLLFEPIIGLFDESPLIDQDWGLHFFHLKSIENFWRQDHLLIGYNPYFMAGYPSNTIQDLSIKFFELISIALSTLSMSTVQWFKLSGFLSMASVPWLMYFSARNFFASDEARNVAALSAALLGTIYWWNSLPREMFFYGMIGFPVASYLSIWGVSLFYRIANEGRAFTPVHLGWLIFALFILPLHVQSILTFVPPTIALLVAQPKLLQRNLLLALLGATAASLLVNSPWLFTAIAHRGDDVSQTIVDQLPLFASTDPFTFLIDYLGAKGYWTFRPSFVEKGLRLALLILGVLGTRKLIQSEQRALGIMLAGAISVLFLVAYFGAFVPSVKAWQPLRFKVPYDLFLSIGAAYAISHWLSGRSGEFWRFVPWLLSIALCAFAVNLVQTESNGKLQLRTQPIPEIAAVIDWIERETPAEARVLFEESGDETGFVYDGMYLSSFVPHRSGRQLIGGPINLYNDRHHFAEFHSGRLFKRDIAAFSDEELRNYLSLYNIGAVVAFHPASLKRFQSMPGLLTLDRRIGPVHLLKVNQTLSWFVQGEGKVKASLNRLELTEIKGNVIVLKYHWVAGLKSEPAAKIEPVKLADDPIPFIKIIDPPASLILRAEP